MEIAQLKLALSQLGLVLDEGKLAQLEAYIQLIDRTNQVLNLTAYSNPEIIREKGIYDSLCFVHPLYQSSLHLLDLGSGAGFPGIPLKIVYPQLQMTLIEPIQKKAQFLKDVIQRLKLKTIDVVAERAEMLVRKKEFQLVDGLVARAVAPLPILLELSLPLLKEKGYALLYKGKDYLAEISQSKHALSTLGGLIHEVKTHRLPTDHEQRSLLVIQKIHATPKLYPRMFSQIKKTPL